MKKSDPIHKSGKSLVGRGSRGGAILLGIINAHTYLTANPTTRRFSFLLEGVTATCDLGGPLESMPESEEENTTGLSARGFHAGSMITAPGGYPDAEGRGHHFNYDVANPDEVKAIVEETRARGRPVRAHVTRADLLDVALDAGVDSIEHIPITQLSEADWEVATDDRDHLKLPADYEAQLVRMVKQRVVMMVPTLSVTPVICNMDWYGTPPEFQPRCSELFMQVVRRFHELGGTVALGNDYGTWRVELGMPLPEMQLLMQAGPSPMEVTQAGTDQAATVCGHGNELGTLEVGKPADLVIVDGKPLMDIVVMNRVVTVIKDGEVIYLQR